MIQQFKTKSGKGNISYQLKVLATITILSSFCLANPAGASNFASKKTSVQSVTTEPNLMAESDWRQFSSSPGNFSLLFPGKPTEEKKNDTYTVTVEGDEGLYLLSYSDLPQAGKLTSRQISKILEFAPGALMSEIDGKLLSSKSISLNGYPGEEFQFTYKNFPGGTGRIYVVGQRLYMMMAVTNQQENSQKFFNSFRLLNNPSLSPLGAG